MRKLVGLLSGHAFRLADNRLFKQVTVALLSLISCVISWVLSGNDKVFNVFCTIFAAGFIVFSIFFGLIDIKRRFVFCMFNATYFIFLMGGNIITLFSGGGFTYFVSSSMALKHTCFCLYISIMFIDTIYIIRRLADGSRSEDIKCMVRPENIPQIGKIISVLLIISFFAKLITEADFTAYLLQTSYRAKYSQDVSMLPGVLQNIASTYYFIVFAYLACFPPKNKVMLTILSVVMVEAVILVSGERGEPISVMVTIIFYIILRNRMGISDISITKKIAIAGIFCLPLVFFCLQALSYLRINQAADFSVSKGIEEFFLSQGGSAKIIANGYDLRDEITSIGGKSFTVGTIVNYLEQNIVSRTFFGIPAIQVHSDQWALSGNVYTATYGLAFSPVIYKNGVGSGTTYIAELFHDYGYLGVAIGSIIISLLIFYVEDIKKKWLSIIICLNIIRYLALMPRALFFAWLVSTFALQNLVLIGFLLYVKNHLEKTNIINIHRNDEMIGERRYENCSHHKRIPKHG